MGPVKMAKGNSFSGSLPHGVYTRPTFFPMRSPGLHAFASGGVGLLAEAGRPEAVLPLSTGPNGDLGVSASGVAPQVNVIVNTRPGETAKVSQDGDTLTIDIIEAELSRRVANGNTSLPRAMQSSFKGMRRG
jgi:phage-related minor tail protein